LGLGTGATAAIIGGIGAAGSVASGVIGAHGANTAAKQEAQAIAPYANAGSNSLGMLMGDLQNGTFGPGSIPQFTAPTLEQAENYPGYQFIQQQGDKAINEASAAAGGAFTGGTVKSLQQYNEGLASTYYGQQFNEAFQTYQAALGRQNQAFQQLALPAELGENAAASLGQAQAAGTIGSTNAITSGLGGATNALTQSLILPSVFNSGLQTPTVSPGGITPGTMAGVEGLDLSSLYSNPQITAPPPVRSGANATTLAQLMGTGPG
jgi:hypothetical protein